MRYFKIIFLIFVLENSFAKDWSGRYLSVSGKNILNIDFVDYETKILSLKVIDAKSSKRKASFIANFEKDLAVTQSLSDLNGDCVLKLQKSQAGIFISDYCNGDNLIGYYQASSDFLFESMNILSL
jgi:GH15 family glucan-1,4-alpha-glucosidase